MQPLRPPASADGAFVRVRTLGFAVEYAGIRVREGTTASETVNLVASKLRLDAAERRSRQLVAVYPVRRRPATAGGGDDGGARGARSASTAGRGAMAEKVIWRVRTLRGDEPLLPVRRRALASAAAQRRREPRVAPEYAAPREAHDEARFYLHDTAASPLDLELPPGDDASGSDTSDDERPPLAKDVVDRAWLFQRATKRGSLLKRSERDPNLWRRRTVVLCNDKVWYWREPSRLGPGFRPPAAADDSGDDGERGDLADLAPEVAWGLAHDAAAHERSRAASIALASNVVKEVPNRREMPHGFEISTASQAFYFRAASKRDQQEWLAALKEGVELATENELFQFAEMIITDEESRRQKREQQAWAEADAREEAARAAAEDANADGAF